MKTVARPARSLPMPLWLQGVVELALVAALSYVAVVLLLAAIWYTNGFNDSTIAGATSVAGHIWLLVHGVPLVMNIPAQGGYAAIAGTMSLVPLGLTLIPLALCYRSGRRLARASYEGQFWQPLAGGLFAYALVSLGVSRLSTGDYFTTSPVLSVVTPLCTVVLGVLAGGYAESRSLAAMIGVNAADWVKKFSQYSRWAGSYAWALVRASMVSVLAFAAGGALLLAFTLFWHWADVVALYQSLRAGAVGGLAVTLLQLGLLLNFVVYSMAWSSGAGFALGTGTSVDLTGTDVGVMPALPILGALPHAAEPWGYLALAVPLLAGALGGWWFFREGENHLDEWFALKIRFRWISWPLSTVSLALLTFLPAFIVTVFLGWIANGSLGLGRFTDIGPNPLIFGAYAAGLLAAGTMLGLGLSHLLVRDTSAELERFAQMPETKKGSGKKQQQVGKKVARAKRKGRCAGAQKNADEGPVEAEAAEPAKPALRLIDPLGGNEGKEAEEAEGAEELAEAQEKAEEPADAEPKKPFRPVVRRPKSRRR
ncbi:MAG: DUF6350 family protein [Rothia sp. (in: high G+C Gram-positive bacteria)]|nr:DUF6350 family protein [Rothia sp. (in: high G+C Gram-positive bacteria)]